MRLRPVARTTLVVLLLLSSAVSCFRHPKIEDGSALQCFSDEYCLSGYYCSRPPSSPTTELGRCAKPDAGTGDGRQSLPSEAGAPTSETDAPIDGGDTAESTHLDAIPETPDSPMRGGDSPLPDLGLLSTDGSLDDIPIVGTGGSGDGGGATGTAGQSGTGAGGGLGGATSSGAGGNSGAGGSGGATRADAAQGTGGSGTGGSGTGGSGTGGSGTGGLGTGGSGTGGSGTGGSGTGGSPPITTISTHPANPTNDQTGDFAFTNTISGVTYKCKLDTGAYTTCVASYTTPALADGAHTLTVQATTPGGLVEASPPGYTWVIDTVAPDTAIVTHADDPSSAPVGSFTFSATGETLAVTYECKLDATSFVACPATYDTPALAIGVHTLSVRATDAAGNTDATPATYSWEIVPASTGCGKTPTLQNSPGTTPNYNTITSSGTSRRYLLRYPASYSNTHPYRLVIAYHWVSGSANQVLDCNAEGISCYTTQGPFFGLWNLANDTTIFIAPDGLNGSWPNTGGQDLVFTDDVLNQVKSDLCIDESRIFANGFSVGGGMTYAIACDRADVFRAVAVYSGGKLSGCVDGTKPIAYYASHGTGDGTISIGLGRSLRDHFVQVNGCTPMTPLDPIPGSGLHYCTTYVGCSAGHPVRWCEFDGALHTPSPIDSGQATTWNPQEAWKFLTQF
jgi:poly(3-hydroxybutyrate) depolymerase